MKHLLWFLITLLLLFPTALTAQETVSDRTFYIFTPPNRTGPMPAIIALHPTASSGLAMQALTGLNSTGEKHGFMIVYPNSQGLNWGDNATDSSLPDDVEFLSILVDKLVEDHHADRDSIYLTGFAGGGAMAYRAACERPDLFKTVAVVGTLMWEHHADNCADTNNEQALSFLLIHGTDDHFYTAETHEYSTIFSNESHLILGIEDTLTLWTERLGCAETPSTLNENAYQYDQCTDDNRVAYYSVEGGGLNWPRQGPYQLNQFGVDASEIIGNFFAEVEDWAVPQSEPATGQPRTYTVYVPSSYNPQEPAPLVIGLHGRYGTGAGHASLTDTNLYAEEHGFIALYPDGLSYGPPGDYGWHYMRGAGLYREDIPDDTAFILALVDDLAVDLNIDLNRVYVNGMSNGGFMVHRLACEAPEAFAAFADVAGSGFQGLETLCAQNNNAPVSMLIIHGTADNNVLWNGMMQEIGSRRIYSIVPIAQMVTFWAQYNRCGNTPDTEVLPQQGQSPGTEVRVMRVTECQNGAEVVLYGIAGGGHNWPGAEGRIAEQVAGDVNLDIHATDVMWSFFSRHTRENQ